MMLKRQGKRVRISIAITVVLGIVMPFSGHSQTDPDPVGPTPNARQIEWYHREIMAFFHYGINPYTASDGVNEGDGNEPPSSFNPTALDCNQWMRVLQSAGISCAILTAKHADGFCNWPTEYTDYCIKNSPWKNGQGDLVQEFTDACRAAGIKPGLYLGPNDRHQRLSPDYNNTFYSNYYANQLSELMRNYGTVWETWWDGAGADDITTNMYTRWYDTLSALQPNCMVFGCKNGYLFADCRWMGNEHGEAGDPCWATINRTSIRDEGSHINELNHGELDGTAYVPAETDVSIRPSWFYHTAEDNQVKSTATLWDIYFTSVGRNSVLLLNFPPDKRGLIHRNDSLKADSLGQLIYGTFKTNLAAGATVTSLHPRGTGFEPENLVDNNEDTYYATTDQFETDTITFDLETEQTFDVVMVQEVITLGHRTTGWEVDAYYNNRWNTIVNDKQCIGYKWLKKFSEVTALQVRLRITGGKACPAIHTFGIYKQQAARPDPTTIAMPNTPSPEIKRNTVLVQGNIITLPADFQGTHISITIFDCLGRVLQCIRVKPDHLPLDIDRIISTRGLVVIKCKIGNNVIVQKGIHLF